MRITAKFLFLIGLLFGGTRATAQFLTFNRTSSTEYLNIYNPFTCTRLNNLPLQNHTFLVSGITVLNKEIYQIGSPNMLMRYNPLSEQMEDVVQFPGNNANGISDDNNNLIYVSTLAGDLYTYNIAESTYTTVSDIDIRTSFTYHDGLLYCVTEGAIIAADPVTGKFLQTVVTKPDSIYNFQSIAVNYFNCDESSLIIAAFETTILDDKKFFYEFILSTNEFRFLCEGRGVSGITEYPTSSGYDCELLVDADKDDSSGDTPYNFRQKNLCTQESIPVTDEDPYVYSTFGPIDSIVAILAAPLPDMLSESLQLPAGSDYTLRGSGSNRIVIESPTFTGYENALRQLRYINSAQPMTPGLREVHLNAFQQDRVSDTATCFIPVQNPISAGRDTLLELCQSAEPILLSDYLSPNATAGGEWMPSENFDPQNTGTITYTYIVSADECPTDTAFIEITVYTPPQATLDADTTVCVDGIHTILPENIEDSYEFIWQDGSISSSLEVTNSGTYTVTISNGACSDTLSQTVEFLEPISFFLPDSVSHCGDSFIIQTFFDPAYNILWSTGETGSTISVFSTGWISFEVSRENCSVKDSIHIHLNQFPAFSLGPDTIVCNGNYLLQLPQDLDPNAEILWQDGSSGPSLLASASGTYFVRIGTGSCISSDTIELLIPVLPALSMGPDLLICDTADLELQVSDLWENIQWSTGHSGAKISVSESGTYSVVADIAGCSKSDEIFIEIQKCLTCNVFIPDAVSPNLDGINEKAEIFSNCSLEISEFSIFDRWGAQVI